jgi:tRNA (guanine37-N1)-methyltransferase
MELLAGENQMLTTVKEHGCSFTFDFSKVYWNSRLQSEHKRLVDTFQKGQTVCDMFAGVGPFAIHAARKGCIVYANDLNPESYSALSKNCKLNHVEDNVHCFNMDAREFVRDLFRKNTELCLDHVIMNLPATAVDFLDAFKGICLLGSPDTAKMGVGCDAKLPMVHCYCFSKAEDPVLDAKNRVLSRLGVAELENSRVYSVRNVAPKKMMMCVSFALPYEVAFAEQDDRACAKKRNQREIGL